MAHTYTNLLTPTLFERSITADGRIRKRWWRYARDMGWNLTRALGLEERGLSPRPGLER